MNMNVLNDMYIIPEFQFNGNREERGKKNSAGK